MLKSSASRQVIKRCRRGVFDYLAAVKTGGADKPAAATATKERSIKNGIPWDFVEWYRPSQTEFAEGMDTFKNMAGKMESYSNEPSRPYKVVDWADWKKRIADPTFVDTVKADFHADVDIANSFTNPDQIFSWSEEAQAERLKAFKEQCSADGMKVGDFVPPKNKEALTAKMDLLTAAGEAMDVAYERSRRELELDYEQVEAERDMFGVKGEMMDFALHPQKAEAEEEMAAGKQTYVDKVLEEYEYCIYAKRERLAQLQTETQRQAFLEKWRGNIKIHGYEVEAMM